jgi:hypothetical protein
MASSGVGGGRRKRVRVEQQVSGEPGVLEKVKTRDIIKEIVRHLTSRDLAQWSTALGWQHRMQLLFSSAVHRVYTFDDQKLMAASATFLENIRPAFPELMSLQFKNTHETPNATAWRKIMTDALQLRSLDWQDDRSWYTNHADDIMPLVQAVALALPSLRLLRIAFVVKSSIFISDMAAAMSPWFRLAASVDPFPLQSLTIDTSVFATSLPADLLVRFADAFPNLTLLRLHIHWNEASLTAVANKWPALTHVELSAYVEEDSGGPLPWMEAKTLVAFMQTKPELKHVTLNKHGMTLVIDNRTHLQYAQHSLYVSTEPWAQLSSETLAVLLATLSTRWTDVTLAVASMQPLIKALLGSMPGRTRIDQLTITNNGAAPLPWEDDAKTPWLSNDEVAALLRDVTACSIRGGGNPTRHITVTSDGKLQCNRLWPVSLYPWIRSGRPFTRIEVGVSAWDDDRVENPDDTPAPIDDEFCHVLLEWAARQHPASPLRRIKVWGRGVEYKDRTMDGKLLARVLLACKPDSSLELADAPSFTSFRSVLELKSSQWPLDVSLCTTDGLSAADWRRIRGQRWVGLESSGAVGVSDVLQDDVLLDLCTNNPDIEVFDLRLPSRAMQPSTPDSDWRMLGECKKLKWLTLKHLPSAGITMQEIQQMIGPSTTEIRIDCDPSIDVYHPLHRWPQPVQWSTWWQQTIGERKLMLEIREQTGKDQVGLLTWADDAVEAKIAVPRITTEVKEFPKGTMRQFMFWRWLAEQSELDVQVLVCLGKSDKKYFFGSPTATNRIIVRVESDDYYSSPLHSVIHRPGHVNEVVCFAAKDKVERLLRRRPGLDAPRAIPPGAILPVGFESASATYGWHDSNHRAAHVWFAHMRLLNPTVSAAALAQYLMRPTAMLHLKEYYARVVRELSTETLDEPADEAAVDAFEAKVFAAKVFAAVAIGAEGGGSASMSAPAPASSLLLDREPTAPRSAKPTASPPPVVEHLLEVARRRFGLDVAHQAHLTAHQPRWSLDLRTDAPSLPASETAQLVRLDVAGRRVVLTVRHASLVEPMQRLLTPRLHNMSLHVRSDDESERLSAKVAR